MCEDGHVAYLVCVLSFLICKMEVTTVLVSGHLLGTITNYTVNTMKCMA